MAETQEVFAPAIPQGAAIMVSYAELVRINTQLAKQEGMLTAALALQGRVDNMDKRLGRVENILSGKAGERSVWNSIGGFAAGVIVAAIGGGAAVFFNYLPMHWGVH